MYSQLLTLEGYAGAGAALGLAVIVMLALRREAGLPLVISAMFVPVVIGAGFGIALSISRLMAVPMLHAAALLAAVLVPLLLIYEWLRTPWDRPPGVG